MAKDGGPAFPTPESHGDDWEGMSLRDYFAAAAMPEIIMFNSGAESHDPYKVAHVAYVYADAMLAERERK